MMGANQARFPERLGLSDAVRRSGNVIWFHAASLGEVKQIQSLVEVIHARFPHQILITTNTQSGAEWVAKEIPFAIHQFAPLDIPAATNRFYDYWSPTAAVFVEGDLWPRLIFHAHEREIPLALINARNSRTRRKFSKSFGVMLSRFSLITCRSSSVADDILRLGICEEHVHVLGDLKAAAPRLTVCHKSLEQLSAAVGTRTVWVAASTHSEDEAPVLIGHRRVLERFPDALLIIAPRHPRRTESINTNARELGFHAAQRSLDEPITDRTDVYIADTLGELGLLFSLTEVVFLGGGFGGQGGHNPYEPARFGVAIVSGPDLWNFAEAFAALRDRSAFELVDESEMVGLTVASLLNSERSHQMAERAKNYMEACENSVPETVSLLESIWVRTY